MRGEGGGGAGDRCVVVAEVSQFVGFEGVEMVVGELAPSATVPHEGTASPPAPGLHKALLTEDLQGLSDGDVGDAEVGGEGGLARQTGPGRQDADLDGPPDLQGHCFGLSSTGDLGEGDALRA